MRLTTASSVPCTASIASRVFRSVASVGALQPGHVVGKSAREAGDRTDLLRAGSVSAIAPGRTSAASRRAAPRSSSGSPRAGRAPCGYGSDPRGAGRSARSAPRGPRRWPARPAELVQPLDDRPHQVAKSLASAAARQDERSSRRSATMSERRSVRSSCVRSSPPAVKTRPISSSFFSSWRTGPRGDVAGRGLGNLLLQPVETLAGTTVSSSFCSSRSKRSSGSARIAASTRSNRSFSRAGSMLRPFRSSSRLTMLSICVCRARGSGPLRGERRRGGPRSPRGAPTSGDAPSARRARSRGQKSLAASCANGRSWALESCARAAISSMLSLHVVEPRLERLDLPARQMLGLLGELRRASWSSLRPSTSISRRAPGASCASIASASESILRARPSRISAAARLPAPRSPRRERRAACRAVPSVSPLEAAVLGNLRGETRRADPRCRRGRACARSRRRP